MADRPDTAKIPRLSWLDDEAREMLSNCFDWRVVSIPAGSTEYTDGRVGWLLSGEGSFAGEAAENASAVKVRSVLSPGMFFGVTRGTERDREQQPGRFRALSPCAVAWFDFDLLLYACYRGCWFHARIMREVDDYLAVFGK